MNAVFVVRGAPHNEELRYSLRSLEANARFVDRVFIACRIRQPWWSEEVEHIPLEDPENKWRNLLHALWKVTESDVSETFTYWNDDQFLLRPFDELPVWHRGPFRDSRGIGSYKAGFKDTAKLMQQMGLADPLDYEVHVPMTFEKAKLRATLEAGWKVRALQYRSLYGNQWGIGGEEIRDVKVYRGDSTTQEQMASWPMLSTNDNSFGGPAGSLLRKMFPEPSRFEVT